MTNIPLERAKIHRDMAASKVEYINRRVARLRAAGVAAAPEEMEDAQFALEQAVFELDLCDLDIQALTSPDSSGK